MSSVQFSVSYSFPRVGADLNASSLLSRRSSSTVDRLPLPDYRYGPIVFTVDRKRNARTTEHPAGRSWTKIICAGLGVGGKNHIARMLSPSTLPSEYLTRPSPAFRTPRSASTTRRITEPARCAYDRLSPNDRLSDSTLAALLPPSSRRGRRRRRGRGRLQEEQRGRRRAVESGGGRRPVESGGGRRRSRRGPLQGGPLRGGAGG